MSAPFKAACVQVNASEDMARNIAAAAELVRAAAAAGAAFVTTPENVSMMTLGRKNALARARAEQDHPALQAFRALADELSIWLLIGSLAIKVDGATLANRTYLIDPVGRVAASYDKIHMFDVELSEEESYRESSTYRSGARAVVVETPLGPIGLTVCYDLRFPYLYRALAGAGAKILTIPSAFTKVTGEAHWHVLLRARAIEHGAFVLAPAQCGSHAGGRRTYGHSLIVAPWGEVLADGGEEPGFVSAEIDLAEVERARRRVPALAHDRAFAGPDRIVALPEAAE